METGIVKFAEMGFNARAEKLKRQYEKAVMRALKYNPCGMCEKREYPKYRACMHYSNDQCSEGIFLTLTLDLIDAGIVGVETFASGKMGVLEVKTHSGLTACGYGERWKSFDGSSKIEIQEKCKRNLGMLECEDVYLLKDIAKFFDLLGLKIPDNFKNEMPWESYIR